MSYQYNMYLIKRIKIDKYERYICSEIIRQQRSSISSALILLDQTAIDYVKEEYGRDMAEKSPIMEIPAGTSPVEPETDGILISKIDSEPYRIFIYQRKTEMICNNSWIWSNVYTPLTTFCKIMIFELEEYSPLIMPSPTSYCFHPLSLLPPPPLPPQMTPPIIKKEVNNNHSLVTTTSPNNGSEKPSIGNLLDELKQNTRYMNNKYL